MVAGKAQPPTHPGPPTRRPHDAGRGAALPAWREHVSPVLRGTPITDRLLEAAGDFQHEETRAHHRWSPTLTGRLNGTPPCRSRPCHLGEGPSPPASWVWVPLTVTVALGVTEPSCGHGQSYEHGCMAPQHTRDVKGVGTENGSGNVGCLRRQACGTGCREPAACRACSRTGWAAETTTYHCQSGRTSGRRRGYFEPPTPRSFSSRCHGGHGRSSASLCLPCCT